MRTWQYLVAGVILMLMSSPVLAQEARTTVVADAVTHQPVAHASLYTKTNGRFHAAISNTQGVARISFQYQRLTVSHLNYASRQFRAALPDTIFLEPKFQMMAEVVVTNKEPEWIKRKLKQAIKLKDQYYFSTDTMHTCFYQTQSLSQNSIYRFQLSGLLRMKSDNRKHYELLPTTADITAADSTRLTDTANLRRMLYEDFMAELDNGFIRSHRFYPNGSYQRQREGEVQLRFRGKHFEDDHGWLVIDTVSCRVLSAWRATGTKVNRQERIDGVMYALARGLGYRIDTWNRDYRVRYAERPDGTLYPAEVNYKLYYGCHDSSTDSKQEEFEKQTGGGFPNMEATLRLEPGSHAALPDSTTWHVLPRSWYIRFNTEADRQKEIELSNLPATFTIYENEP